MKQSYHAKRERGWRDGQSSRLSSIAHMADGDLCVEVCGLLSIKYILLET